MSLKKCAPKRTSELIPKDSITEELFLVDGSSTDYITKSGKIYKDYGNNMFFPKKTLVNNHNGYVYVNITFSDGVNRSRRLHVLLGKTFIENPDPKKYKIVGHKDNNKQNYELNNLYWTTTQENTQKAVNDGLVTNKVAEESEFSLKVKVIDKNTFKIVGVYGSISKCSECIKNASKSFISKMCKQSWYIPRLKNYIYRYATDEEFNEYKALYNVKLQENSIKNKNPKIFIMKNVHTGFLDIFDNQTQASKICGIAQAQISHYLLDGDVSEHNGWAFQLINETSYRDSSAYGNLIKTLDTVTIKNIYDDRILEFETSQQLKNFLKLNGHDINHYVKTNQVLSNEWVIINKG